MEGELEQSDQTTAGVEKTSSDAPLEQPETQDSQPVPQGQDGASENTSHELSDSKGISSDDSEDKPSKAEIGENSTSSVVESKASTETLGLNSTSVASSQPIHGRQYQLAFDVDDTGSEAGSPRLVDMSNPVMSYLSQHHCLPSPMASQSHDLESLPHEESRDHTEEISDGDGAKPEASSIITSVEDVFSSSTLQPGSTSEQQQGVATTCKPAPSDTSESERKGSVKSPDSVVKMEDITLTTDSPNGSLRHESPPPHPKEHALNILTSDSEGGETPPYSPVPYLSGQSN